MKKYTFLILALLISATTFAQKSTIRQTQAKPASKTRFFVDEKETDILVAKLIDPKNYASVGLSGVSPSDMTSKKMSKTPTALRMVTKPDAKFMNLGQFFERYKVPPANQQLIKVNGELLTIKEGFLANETRIAKVEINKDAAGNPFINIIIK